jgi:hypothetical protein
MQDEVQQGPNAPEEAAEGHEEAEQHAGNKGRAPLDEGAGAANADEVHERRRERRSAPNDEAEGLGEAVQQEGNEGQGPADDGAAAASADTAVASHVNAAALAITTDGWGNTACLSLCNDPIADKAKAHGLVPAREPSRHNPGKLHEALGEGDLQQRLGYRDNGGL